MTVSFDTFHIAFGILNGHVIVLVSSAADLLPDDTILPLLPPTIGQNAQQDIQHQDTSFDIDFIGRTFSLGQQAEPHLQLSGPVDSADFYQRSWDTLMFLSGQDQSLNNNTQDDNSLSNIELPPFGTNFICDLESPANNHIKDRD